NPVSAPRAMRALEAMHGIGQPASEQELTDAAARADATGMYTRPHTAVGLAVLEQLRARDAMRPDDRGVCLSTANGHNFTAVKVKYHEGLIDGVTSNLRNPAVMLPADYGQVVDAISRRFS